MSHPADPGLATRLRQRLAAAARDVSLPMFVAVAAAVMALALLQWRHEDSRMRLARSVGTLDNVLQARLHVTRAYLIATRAAAGDPTFARADAVAAVDRASLAVRDWLTGRTTRVGIVDPSKRDPALRTMLVAYARDLAQFREVLTATRAGPGGQVVLRAAFATLEDHHDRIERRSGLLLTELAQVERRDHAITVFLIGFFVLATGAVLDRLLRARARMEARLGQAQKMEAIGRVSAGVAHDFNNLLTVILTNAELLRDQLPAGDERRAEVDDILSAGGRGTRLVRQLLTVGRQQAPHGGVGAIDLAQLVADMQPNLQRLSGNAITVDVIAPAALPPVAADHGQMEQVLLNLVANARDAMPQGGRITIALHPGERHGRVAKVRLLVSDTGIGMDEETRSRIFEPFYTTKAEHQGTGLGLATVYGIVKQSGGSISVNTAPGRGTTFIVELPAAA